MVMDGDTIWIVPADREDAMAHAEWLQSRGWGWVDVRPCASASHPDATVLTLSRGWADKSNTETGD
jgi:hypothetical protein